jgi:hypothetical protein
MRDQSEPSNFAAIKTPISKEGLDQLFRKARTHAAWLPEPVPVEFTGVDIVVDGGMKVW